ncbi:MAG: M1 family metallopeptidase [Bacteroidota bacterium]
MNNKGTLWCLAILFAWWFPVEAQEEIFAAPLSTRIANYDIEVELDTERKMLRAKEILYWKNTSPDVIKSVQFHLYYNAFKNTQSTFYQESLGVNSVLNFDLLAEDIWGWIDIDQIRDQAGNDLKPSMRFIHPDDDNEQDQTVVVFDLARPLQPGETLELHIDFTSKIPRTRVRSGYNREFYHMAQWFPKIGVYEYPGIRCVEESQWNCHQYHRNSEYYADFGVYNVHITVPKNYVVGASGNLQYEKTKGEQKTYYYRAEDVIDFAWSASPHFVERTDRWKHIDIRVLCYPEHQDLTDRHVLSAKQTMEYFEKHVGPYPYPTLTIVNPPLHASRTGAMEYPTLITTIGFARMPSWIPMTETFTVHEFVHQYFMGMVATNEFEESWLDEGITSYFENRVMDHYYGKQTSTFEFMGFRVGDGEQSRLGYVGMDNPSIAEVYRPTWEFKHGGYRPIIYNKSPTWLKTLEGIVGWDTMNEIMNTFFLRWRFKHPCTADFVDLVNEVVIKNHGDRFGKDMHWFFDQVLHGTEVCDYKVVNVNNRRIGGGWGVFGADKKEQLPGAVDTSEVLYHSRVILHRLGGVKLPVEVLVHFEDGTEKLEYWDGRAPTYEFSYRGSHKVVWAKLDPEYKIDMDINFNNNSYTTQPKTTALRKYAAKFMMLIQNVMLSLSCVI